MTNQQRGEPAVILGMHMFFLASLRLQLNITSEKNFFFSIFINLFGSMYVSEKLTTYPSPKPTVCLK